MSDNVIKSMVEKVQPKKADARDSLYRANDSKTASRVDPQNPAGADRNHYVQQPEELELPHSKFLVCKPEYLSTKIANNVFMEGDNHEEPDVPRACNQWDRSAHIMEAFGAELFEIPPTKGCQDQAFTANIGIAIEPYFILSNFKAPGRACEIDPAKKFLVDLGYNCIQSPYKWEGIADLKKWKDGHYFGGFGLFSTKEAYRWIEEKTGVKIIDMHMIDPAIYHEDCVLLVVDEENFLVTKKGFDKESIKKLEKCGNIIFTPEGIETTGITNGIPIVEKGVYLSGAFQQEQKDYRRASEWLLETMDGLGYTVVFIDCDAYGPSGADASCTVCSLDFFPSDEATSPNSKQ